MRSEVHTVLCRRSLPTPDFRLLKLHLQTGPAASSRDTHRHRARPAKHESKHFSKGGMRFEMDSPLPNHRSLIGPRRRTSWSEVRTTLYTQDWGQSHPLSHALNIGCEPEGFRQSKLRSERKRGRRSVPAPFVSLIVAEPCVAFLIASSEKTLTKAV